jgi:hypothetical protein
MRRGDFAAAWSICDEVLQERVAKHEACWHWPRHLQYVWDGSSLRDRRVLVRCYHGLGDSIQFARFLAPLRKLASEVTLWVQPQLLALLEEVRGVDRILPLHDGAPEVDYDVDIEIMELGHALRIDESMIRGCMPYLHLPARSDSADCPDDILKIPSRHSRPMRVGLAWRAGDWDEGRSLPDALAMQLMQAAPQIQWYSLQYPALPLPESCHALDIGCRDIVAMGHRMRLLDLVLSVDTMTAHLAGALCLPVWTLLRKDSDWRWMSARDDTPWYPSMRLFRQSAANEWSDVIEQIVAALSRRNRRFM